MIKRILMWVNLPLGLAIIALVTFSVAPMAQAAAGPFCASYGSGECLSDNGNGPDDYGSVIYTLDNNPGGDQNITLPVSNVCNNGHVDDSCPFNDTTLDQTFAGNPIENLKFSNYNNYCAVGGFTTTGSTNVVTGKCVGVSGVDWVVIPHNTGYQLINVYSTNSDMNDSIPQYLVSQGKGWAAVTESASEATPSNWSH